jgi:hypothetical protein
MNPNAASKPALRSAGLSAATILLCAPGLASLSAVNAAAQSNPSPPIHVYTGQPAGGGGNLTQQEEASDTQSIEYEKHLRLLNAERQKSMVADAAKLLKLAQALNDELAAQPGDPTPAQLRKMAEIEKLARSVKEDMSTSVRGLAPFTGPGTPIR